MTENHIIENKKNIARVVGEHKTTYILRSDEGEYTATVRGKFHLEEDFPKVGDFVEFVETSEGKGFIESVLPRKTKIVRDVSERSRRMVLERPQVIVTNVDVMCIVMGVDNDFNINRLERYILLAKKNNIRAVVVLNKIDTVTNPAFYEVEVKRIVPEVPVHLISALQGDNRESLLQYVSKGATVVLLGSSGSGKSTITNWLLGNDVQAVQGVRSDDSRGRHTTTSRELFNLPGGGFLIDTPGMRGLGLVEGVIDVEENFYEQINSLIAQCHFSDCDHKKSEGCMVIDAIQKGELDKDRFDHYQKLEKEKLVSNKKITKESSLQRKKRIQRLSKDRRSKHLDEDL